jgi:hypothetical protein
LTTAKCLLHLSLKNAYVGLEFKLPPSLEVLIGEDVAGAMPASAVPDQQQGELATFHNLTIIRTVTANSLLSRSFEVIKAAPDATLTKLDVTGGDWVPEILMTLLKLSKLSRLAFLGLRDVAVTDRNVHRLAVECSMLERVEFSGLRITGIAVKDLCVHTAIKELTLMDCCHISADAIEWARGRGITVIVKQSEERTGRRIRHG